MRRDRRIKESSLLKRERRTRGEVQNVLDWVRHVLDGDAELPGLGLEGTAAQREAEDPLRDGALEGRERALELRLVEAAERALPAPVVEDDTPEDPPRRSVPFQQEPDEQPQTDPRRQHERAQRRAARVLADGSMGCWR